MTDFENQIDLFTMSDEKDKNNRISLRSDLPQIITLEAGDPKQADAVMWALDYDWHMAVHECPALLEERKRVHQELKELNKLEAFYKIRPVVYFSPWGKNPSWYDNHPYHHAITSCLYCGADLQNWRGKIIVERRKKSGYICVYDREWGEV